MSTSPLLVKTYDFLQWLLPSSEKFRKSQRFVLGQRLQQAAFQFYECLIAARRTRPNEALLQQADIELEKVRLYLRLSHEMGLLGADQYRHASQMTTEMGKLLGGWQKAGPTRQPGE